MNGLAEVGAGEDRFGAAVRAIALAAFASVAFLLLGASPATAARSLEFQVKGPGPSAPVSGDFGSPQGIAIDGGDNLWVTDGITGAVTKFTNEGDYVAQNTGAGRWGPSVGDVAYRAASDEIYLMDSGGLGGFVYVLNSGDATVADQIEGGAFGGCCYYFIATDNSGSASDGTVLITSYSGPVVRHDGEGEQVSWPGIENKVPYLNGSKLLSAQGDPFGELKGGIDVDGDGNLYVSDASERRVYKFDSEGIFTETIKETKPGAAGLFQGVAGTAVDPTNDHLLVADSGRKTIEEFDADGKYLETIDVSGVLGGVGMSSIAVSSNGNLFVSGGETPVVSVFTPTQVVPKLTTAAATAPTRSSLTVNGSVDPKVGTATECEVIYGTTYAYGQSKPCAPAGPYAGPTSVHADLSGLTAETVYHYRIVARNANGLSRSGDRTYKPDAVYDLTTGGSADILGQTAKLQGSLDPDGYETDYYFEFGTTEAYGQKSGVQEVGGTGAKSINSPIAGLTADTVYQYRLVAENQFGTSFGQNQSFKTLKTPTVSTTYADTFTTSSAVLNTTVNPETKSTSVHFEYGPTTAYGLTTPESAPVGSDNILHPANAKIEALSPGLTYHYRVIATSASGVTVGPDNTFTTIPLLATVESTSTIDVSGNAATLQAQIRPGFSATSYVFQYGATDKYGAITLPSDPIGADDGPHLASTTISGLQSGTTYHFRVIATNFAGTTTGADQTFTTQAAPRVLEASASNVGTSVATLSAQVVPNLSPTTARFEYGTTAGYGLSTAESGVLGADLFQRPTSATLTGLAPGTTYHARAVASNGIGSTSGNDVVFTTAPAPRAEPSPPGPARCRKGFVKKKGKCVKKPKRKQSRGGGRKGG